MECQTEAGVEAVFEAVPAAAREQLLALRSLILEAATDEGIDSLSECLRWGEPSYIAKGGSALRLGWKPGAADQTRLLFHCQTRLVDTFKELYGDQFRFEGNRAMVFDVRDCLPRSALLHCASLALTYQRRKDLPLLGA